MNKNVKNVNKNISYQEIFVQWKIVYHTQKEDNAINVNNYFISIKTIFVKEIFVKKMGNQNVNNVKLDMQLKVLDIVYLQVVNR